MIVSPDLYGLAFHLLEGFFDAIGYRKISHKLGKFDDFLDGSVNIRDREFEIHLLDGRADIDKGADSRRIDIVDLLKVDDEGLHVLFKHLHDEFFQLIGVIEVHFAVYVYDVHFAVFPDLKFHVGAAPFPSAYALIFMTTRV
jgi:hypothetical protein